MQINAQPLDATRGPAAPDVDALSVLPWINGQRLKLQYLDFASTSPEPGNLTLMYHKSLLQLDQSSRIRYTGELPQQILANPT